jgi:SSS family solute:Na+ symporter
MLIACCYWKRANDWGAFASLFVSAVIPLAYLVMQQVPATRALAERIGPYYSGIAAFAASALGMIAGSLLKPAVREFRL